MKVYVKKNGKLKELDDKEMWELALKILEKRGTEYWIDRS